MDTSRLMIVGTDRVFRECLASILTERDSFSVIDAVGDFAEADRRLANDQPDVLLIDVSRPDDSVHQMLQNLLEGEKGMRVLLLGSEQIDRDVLSFVKARAMGYVSSGSSLADLCVAVDKVRRNELVFSPDVAYTMFSQLAEISLENRRSQRLESLKLTAREMEILALVAEGLTNKQIGERLALSIHTIKNHVHNILDKLGVQKRSDAVEHAYRMGWLKLSRDY